MSFEQLLDRYRLPRIFFFIFAIKQFYKDTDLNFFRTPTVLFWKSYITNLHKRGIKNYQSFMIYWLLILKENSYTHLFAWTNDVQIDISVEDWELCLVAQTQTVQTRFRLLQYKWLLRTYCTLPLWSIEKRHIVWVWEYFGKKLNNNNNNKKVWSQIVYFPNML